MIKGLQFNKQGVASARDGGLYQKIIPNDGIIWGCEFSATNDSFTIATGQLMIGGRGIYIDGATTVDLSAPSISNGYAQIIMNIDLTRTATKEEFNQAFLSVAYSTTQTFPALTQGDINTNSGDTFYQVEIAVLVISGGAVTDIVSEIAEAGVKAQEYTGGDVEGGINFTGSNGVSQMVGANKFNLISRSGAGNIWVGAANDPTGAQGNVYLATKADGNVYISRNNVRSKIIDEQGGTMNGKLVFQEGAGISQKIGANEVNLVNRSNVGAIWVGAANDPSGVQGDVYLATKADGNAYISRNNVRSRIVDELGGEMSGGLVFTGNNALSTKVGNNILNLISRLANGNIWIGAATDPGAIQNDVYLVTKADGNAYVSRVGDGASRVLDYGFNMKELWSGNWSSGSITVPGLSDYSVVLIDVNGTTTRIVAVKEATALRGGNFFTSAAGTTYFVDFSANVNNNILVYENCATHNINATWGLATKEAGIAITKIIGVI